MRRLLRNSILSLSMLSSGSLPLLSHAEGAHEVGSVRIEDRGAITVLLGAMNTRYDTQPTPHLSELAVHASPGYVLFWGHDTGGQEFYCTVRSTNPMYHEVLHYFGSVTNGTYLRAEKPTNSDECSHVEMGMTSALID